MKTKKQKDIVVLTSMILIIINMLSNFYIIIHGVKVNALISILQLVAMLMAVIYIYLDFSKKARFFFFLYGIFFYVAELLNLLGWTAFGERGEYFLWKYAGCLLCFSLICLFFGARDLGKIKSGLILGLMILLASALLGIQIYTNPGALFGGTAIDSLTIVINESRVVLLLLLAIMTYGKYVDKSMRYAEQEAKDEALKKTDVAEEVTIKEATVSEDASLKEMPLAEDLPKMEAEDVVENVETAGIDQPAFEAEEENA